MFSRSARRLLAAPLPALLCLFDALPDAAVAQRPLASLVIQVTGEAGNPLGGAQVVLPGRGIGALTNELGTARLDDFPTGTQPIEVRFLGYAPQSALVPVQAGRTTTVHFTLTVQPIRLAEVRVTARRSILATNGFLERRAGGHGTFLTRDDIDRMRPTFLSDVLRRVAGVNVRQGPFLSSSRASMRGNNRCPIQYYVDGTLSSMFNVDEVLAGDVEGLEIYRGAATIPAVFNKGSAMCGVVVIWTRVN